MWIEASREICPRRWSLRLTYYNSRMLGVVVHTLMFGNISFGRSRKGSRMAWEFQLRLYHRILFPVLGFWLILLIICSPGQIFLRDRDLAVVFIQCIIIPTGQILSLGYMLLVLVIRGWHRCYMFILLNWRLIWLNFHTGLSITVLEFFRWFSTNGSTRILMSNDHYTICFLLALKWNSIVTLCLTVSSIIPECHLIWILLLAKLLILLKRCIMQWLLKLLHFILWALCIDRVPPVLSLIITGRGNYCVLCIAIVAAIFKFMVP